MNKADISEPVSEFNPYLDGYYTQPHDDKMSRVTSVLLIIGLSMLGWLGVTFLLF